MLGWLYFIAACYIVTTIAKLTHKGINYLINKAYKFLKSHKHKKTEYKVKKETLKKFEEFMQKEEDKQRSDDNNVHECS